MSTTTERCFTFWLAFLGGFFEGFLRLKVAKEGNALGFLVLFFDAPYGRFINWKTSS